MVFKVIKGYVIHRQDVALFIAYDAKDHICYVGVSYQDVVRQVLRSE